jgi:hypothetical protein
MEKKRPRVREFERERAGSQEKRRSEQRGDPRNL